MQFTKEFNEKLKELNTNEIKTSKKLTELIKRPQLSLEILEKFCEPSQQNLTFELKEEIETDFKYEEFVKKQQQKMLKLTNVEKIKLLKETDYEKISGLRKEAREKLNKIKPESLGQASRISGVNPADIAVLLIYLKTKNIR